MKRKSKMNLHLVVKMDEVLNAGRNYAQECKARLVNCSRLYVPATYPVSEK